MNSLIQYRCLCGKLLFKATYLSSRLEIKCKRCGLVIVLNSDGNEEIKNSCAWVAQINEDGIFTYVSSSVVNTLGYHPVDMLYKSMFDFYSEKEKEDKKKEFMKLLSTGTSFRIVNNNFSSRDGRIISLEACFVPCYDDRRRFIVGFT